MGALFRFGVSTMVYLTLPPSKAMERILLNGFRVVELSYDNFLSSGVRELVELGRVVDAASKYSLESISVHLPYDSAELTGSGLSSAIDRLSKWVRALDALRAHSYVVHLPSLPPSGESVGSAVAYLKSLADLAGGDSWVLVENAASAARLGARPGELLEVLKEVGTAKVGVCVDVGHAMIAKVPLRAFSSLLGGSIRSVHVHDNDGSSDKHLLPGYGVLSLDELAEFLAAARPHLVVAEVACRGLTECDGVLRSIRGFELTLRSMVQVRAY